MFTSESDGVDGPLCNDGLAQENLPREHGCGNETVLDRTLLRSYNMPGLQPRTDAHPGRPPGNWLVQDLRSPVTHLVRAASGTIGHKDNLLCLRIGQRQLQSLQAVGLLAWCELRSSGRRAS